jgi:hypothetical protein
MISPAVAADLLALVHLAYVGFVVVGQALILWGGVAGWPWIRNPWFRWLHLGAIGIVVAEVALGVYCPLTLLEARWRGEAVDGAGFIADWVGALLYYDIALWQAHVAYLLFALITVGSFLRWPPRRFRASARSG